MSEASGKINVFNFILFEEHGSQISVKSVILPWTGFCRLTHRFTLPVQVDFHTILE